MNIWFLFGLALLGGLFTLFLSFKPILEDYYARGKVLNFDEGMRSYFFLLPGGGEALRQALAADQPGPFPYAYNAEAGTLLLSRDNIEAEFRLSFFEHAGRSGLQATRTAEQPLRGTVPYSVNIFFIKGFGAQPVDYRKFPELFPAEQQAEE